ncbi:DUF2914 domain-containing protein [Nitrosomonas aestuarii]|uniref:DUF2914 domain-containing protein n=1 Tax=Nitrosomonas aestuarii TaxID=52441 RepID=UPI000D2F4C81|nr:DUF2914 domain-containing protein [Nitrosomonas aestuarii]PTN11127.1 Protein of unknown function (DUF2914) [Nitrosomonas aestuarii]
MSDNKLKIRIQIQQPKAPEAAEVSEATTVAEAPVSDNDLQNSQHIFEKPPLDWRKIVLALLLLVVISGTIGYLFFGRSDSATDTDEFFADAKNTTDITTNFNQFDDGNTVKSTPDLQSESDNVAFDEPIQKSVQPNTLIAKPKPGQAIKAAPMPPLPNVKPDYKADNAQQTLLHNNNSTTTPAANEPNPANHPQVARVQLTHAIRNREPADETNHIQLEQDTDATSIYFFVELHDFAGQQVTVNWYFEDELVSETQLQIAGNNWRTYANKLLNKESIGSWRTVLTDQEGNQLAEKHFVVSNGI